MNFAIEEKKPRDVETNDKRSEKNYYDENIVPVSSTKNEFA